MHATSANFDKALGFPRGSGSSAHKHSSSIASCQEVFEVLTSQSDINQEGPISSLFGRSPENLHLRMLKFKKGVSLNKERNPSLFSILTAVRNTGKNRSLIQNEHRVQLASALQVSVGSSIFTKAAHGLAGSVDTSKNAFHPSQETSTTYQCIPSCLARRGGVVAAHAISKLDTSKRLSVTRPQFFRIPSKSLDCINSRVLGPKFNLSKCLPKEADAQSEINSLTEILPVGKGTTSVLHSLQQITSSRMSQKQNTSSTKYAKSVAPSAGVEPKKGVTSAFSKSNRIARSLSISQLLNTELKAQTSVALSVRDYKLLCSQKAEVTPF